MSTADGPLRCARRVLLRPRGDRMWDAFLRGTGVAAVIGLACVFLVPESGPLIGLWVFTLWIQGPLSPVFPVGLEMLLMVFGRLHPPWLVAAVVMTSGLYGEFVSWHLYGHVVGLDVARDFRESRAVQWTKDLFQRRPFLASWICAWSPVPFWVIRILGPLSGYSVWKALTANLLGRYPKLWLFAAIGLVVPVSDGVLWAGFGVGLVAGAAYVLYRRVRKGQGRESGVEGTGPTARDGGDSSSAGAGAGASEPALSAEG